MLAEATPEVLLPHPSLDRRACFLGRQPILDGDGRVVAHDLLFRDSEWATHATHGDPLRATVQVLLAAFSELGIESLLGPGPGFVNADPELEITNHSEALARMRLVFDVPPLEEVDETIIERVNALRKA